MKFKLCFLVISVSLFLLLGGCSFLDFIGNDSRPGVTPLKDNTACCEIERLTNNGYQDSSPQIAIDNVGTVAVLWLSLEMRTPVIKGRFLSRAGSSGEQELGACVGHWDVSPRPKGGFLLVKSHWGNLYARELTEGGKKKEQHISSGMISSPILVANDRIYILWLRKMSAGVNAVEGAIYDEGNRLDPILIITTKQRIIRAFMLGASDELLLVVALEENGGSSIYVARLTGELALKGPLTQLVDLRSSYPNVEGIRSSDGDFWLAWDEGAKGGEQIYVSSSSNGEVWSEPERISIVGERNINPAIVADQDVIYVIWTSFARRGGDGEQYGEIKGRWHRIGTESWREILGLYQKGSPILGREAAIDTSGGQLWLAWEWEGEIYVTTLIEPVLIEGEGTQMEVGPTVGESTHTPCLEMNPPAFHPDEVQLAVEGQNLNILHKSAVTNCCLATKMEVSLGAGKVEVHERESEGIPCPCICTRDLAVTIYNLNAGDYTVQLFKKKQSEPFWSGTVRIPSN